MKLPHFLGLFICVAAATAFADENMTRNGVTWNATYEGDVFPSASSPVWSIYANSGSWTANNNIPGIFTQDTYIESAGAWQVSTGRFVAAFMLLGLGSAAVAETRGRRRGSRW